MPILHLAQVQLEVRRRPIAGMTIPPVGEQDAPISRKNVVIGIACFTWPPSAPSATCDGSFREQEYWRWIGDSGGRSSILPYRSSPRAHRSCGASRTCRAKPRKGAEVRGEIPNDRIGAGMTIRHRACAHLVDQQATFSSVAVILRARIGIRVLLPAHDRGLCSALPHARRSAEQGTVLHGCRDPLVWPQGGLTDWADPKEDRLPV